MSFTVVIPARYASTRLPGKPLAMIHGKPMIQYVYEQALASDAERVIVATDDERIVEALKQFNAEYCLTKVNHVSGTDRIQEVACQYELDEDSIVVNVQGDEPLIPPAVINQVATNLEKNTLASAATLYDVVEVSAHTNNPNAVKLVHDIDGYALYFSRSPIPHLRDSKEIESLFIKKHIGIYAYRTSLLNDFVTWPVAELESTESLEQLRILANGHKIHVEEAIEAVPGGVDTEDDLNAVREVIRS